MCLCFTGLSIILGVIACGNAATEPETAAPPDRLSRTQPRAADAAQPGAGSGKVLEKIDASSYTYVRLDDGRGKEIWAAIPGTQLEIGEQVTLEGGTVMRNFNSKTLNRTFDSIIFATGVARAGGNNNAPTPAAAMAGSGFSRTGSAAPDPHSQFSSGSGRPMVPFVDLKVEKSTARNGYTVGELFTKAASLNSQKVTVKGQVVKVNPEIMGKNWLHIQDGTGDPSKNTHDLVVTSADMAEKGAIISLEGILTTDKDFGSGYRYDVIVEHAVLVK